MRHGHVPGHGRRRGSTPALVVAAVLFALFVCSLAAIILFLHHLVQLAQLALSSASWIVGQ